MSNSVVSNIKKKKKKLFIYKKKKKLVCHKSTKILFLRFFCPLLIKYTIGQFTRLCTRIVYVVCERSMLYYIVYFVFQTSKTDKKNTNIHYLIFKQQIRKYYLCKQNNFEMLFVRSYIENILYFCSTSWLLPINITDTTFKNTWKKCVQVYWIFIRKLSTTSLHCCIFVQPYTQYNDTNICVNCPNILFKNVNISSYYYWIYCKKLKLNFFEKRTCFVRKQI